MNARRADGVPATQSQPRRRRWSKRLGVLAVLGIVLVLVAAHFLQPARLTALVLDRASRTLQLDLRTSSPGSYALRPEPRLVLPGLSARMPGESEPFFRSAEVELALPWSTLRGRGTEISSIVLKSPEIDLSGLHRWLATLPPRTTPRKLPTLIRGLRIDDGLLRGGAWRIEHIDLTLPSLADGKPSTLAASGDLVRAASTSTFKLTFASTPAGMGHGLRIDNARILLVAENELPSLSASGSLHDADTFAVDLTGVMQRVPHRWAASIDSAFTRPGDTPFSIVASDGAPTPVANTRPPTGAAQPGMRLRFAIGDPKRQPALTLSGELDGEAMLNASLHGQLSRWPDAWPGLPVTQGTTSAPIVFDASYRGSFLLGTPIVFHVTRADTSLQGQFRIADVRRWISNKFDTLLPPIEATLSAPQMEVGGMQLHDVQLNIRDDAAPVHPTGKPPATAPKS